MNIVAREHPLKHYQWGEACDGWNLVHYHREAQQFFFILKGVALFETGEGRFIVGEQREGDCRINVE
jgi:mannose-6-phosphate isomerase-like protein (cupin superfamily)